MRRGEATGLLGRSVNVALLAAAVARTNALLSTLDVSRNHAVVTAAAAAVGVGAAATNVIAAPAAAPAAAPVAAPAAAPAPAAPALNAPNAVLLPALWVPAAAQPSPDGKALYISRVLAPFQQQQPKLEFTSAAGARTAAAAASSRRGVVPSMRASWREDDGGCIDLTGDMSD